MFRILHAFDWKIKLGLHRFGWLCICILISGLISIHNTTIDSSIGVKSNRQFEKSKQNDSNEKPEELYCICRSPNDDSLYVFCEACQEWFHPKCVFKKDHLALILSEEQWKNCNCVCTGVNLSLKNNLTTLYHSVKTVDHHKTITTLDKQRFAEVLINIDFHKGQCEKKGRKLCLFKKQEIL